MAYNVAPPNGWPQLNINDVDVDTSALANKADIATEFSDLTNYSAGDLVYYDGALYEFQTDHTAGVWDTSEVIQKDISDVVSTLNGNLSSIRKFGWFDVTVPSGVTSYNYGSEKPSDFDGLVNAISVGGAGADIMQASNTILYFRSELTGVSGIRILYIKA